MAKIIWARLTIEARSLSIGSYGVDDAVTYGVRWMHVHIHVHSSTINTAMMIGG